MTLHQEDGYQHASESRRQVAVTLYYLPDEERLRKTANSFGSSKSSVSIIMRRVIHDMVFILDQRTHVGYVHENS